MSEAVSISDEVLELTADGPRLIGARCEDCGNYVFPAQSGCSRCTGSRMQRVVLGTQGTLWAWTIQGFPPKSPPYLGDTARETFKPYGVGYVTIPGELKVEGRLTEADPKRLKEGMRMRLVTVPLRKDDNGRDVVTFAFEPVEGESP